LDTWIERRCRRRCLAQAIVLSPFALLTGWIAFVATRMLLKDWPQGAAPWIGEAALAVMFGVPAWWVVVVYRRWRDPSRLPAIGRLVASGDLADASAQVERDRGSGPELSHGPRAGSTARTLTAAEPRGLRPSCALWQPTARAPQWDSASNAWEHLGPA